MEDLAALNMREVEFFQTDNASMIRICNLITVRKDCPAIFYMDSLYELWGSDTVHGDKISYSKMANGLLDTLNRHLPESDIRHNLHSRKTSLDVSSDFYSWREIENPRRFSDHYIQYYILLGSHELRARRTMCKSVFFSKVISC